MRNISYEFVDDIPEGVGRRGRSAFYDIGREAIKNGKKVRIDLGGTDTNIGTISQAAYVAAKEHGLKGHVGKSHEEKDVVYMWFTKE